MGQASLLLRLVVLVPLPFLLLEPFLGQTLAFAALFYQSIFTFLADQAVVVTNATQPAPNRGERAFSSIVPVILALGHFALLPIGILAVSRWSGGWLESITVFLAFGLFFGTVSTANAHELIHRSDRLRHTLGKWIFTSILFGHHTSAHLMVHHRLAATPMDPNTARLNEGFYAFFIRAWRDSFREGARAERWRERDQNPEKGRMPTEFKLHFGGNLVFALIALTIAGRSGLFAYLGFSVFAQTQLLLSDYIQHYGLQRRILPNGRYEPIGLRHSWNAPHIFSDMLMLSAPRHSDHHVHPGKTCIELGALPACDVPVLPHSLPVMSCIALFPKTWRRIMNPLVAVRARKENPDHRNFVPNAL